MVQLAVKHDVKLFFSFSYLVRIKAPSWFSFIRGVWLSGNTLVSINEVTIGRARLVLVSFLKETPNLIAVVGEEMRDKNGQGQGQREEIKGRKGKRMKEEGMENEDK